MDTVKWDQSLSVGIALVDEQHQMLIQKVNDVAGAVARREGEKEIAKTLDFLSKYAEFHFSAEEKCMADSQYPGLAEQQAQHQEFRTTLADMAQVFAEDGPSRTLTQDVNTLLGAWLVTHIKQTDAAFGKFMAKRAK